MKAEITTITPDQAKRLLKGNTNNRNIREERVRRYARDMQANQWVPNGVAIVMNGRTLIDGQHRLEACVLADVPFKTVYVTGVSPEAFATMDSGASRSLGDVLKMKGEHDPNSLSGAITSGWKWDNGQIPGGRMSPSNSEALVWLEVNPEVREAIKMVTPLRYNPLRAPRSSMGLVVMKAIQAGHDDEIREFVDGLVTGAGLVEGDPILLLRNQLMTNATNHKKMPLIRVFAHIVKAWNAHIADETMGILKWVQRGQKREQFPVMVNSIGAPISYIPTEED
jgi:hypothetical protein